MNTLLLAFVICSFICPVTKATDFKVLKVNVDTPEPSKYSINVTVRNDNMLDDAFAIRVDIYKGSSAAGTHVWNTFHEEPTLEKYSNRSVLVSELFTTTDAGEYYVYARILYAYDIDTTNNWGSTVFIAENPGCVAKETWHSGPPMVIVNNISSWPSEPLVSSMLRPGDVIAFSAFVTDEDYLIHGCECAGDDTSAVRGPYPDDVQYRWKLSGEGTLVNTGNTQNTIMWQLPACPNSRIYEATIDLEVTNSGSKAADLPLTGTIVVRVNTWRIYDADTPPNWQPYTYDVVVDITPLKPKSGGNPELEQGKACTPQDVIWEKASGIEVVGNGIQRMSAPMLCPEYATVLSVLAMDKDKMKLPCDAAMGTCGKSDTLTAYRDDGLFYQWSIVGGAGELPLGSSGPTVVVRRSAMKNTIVQCIINDGGSMADDEAVVLRDTLPPVGKPKALVGLGDDEGTSLKKFGKSVWDGWLEILGYDTSYETIYGGRSMALRRTFNAAFQKLAGAGYEVIRDDSLLQSELSAYVKDPCIKAMVFVGHGASGRINMARENIGGWVNPTFSLPHLVSAITTAFSCQKHPFLRDVLFLACEVLQAGWDGHLVWGRVHGWDTTKRFAVLEHYASWTYNPFPPIVLTVD